MTSTATLTEQYVLSILSQEAEGTEFPVALDDIWESAGYTQKKNAIRFLTKSLKSLEEGKHYIIRLRSEELQRGIRSSHSIHLTVDAYRFFLTKSNTDQGDANLWYLIEIEKRYREQLERQLAATAATHEVDPEIAMLQLELSYVKKRWVTFADEIALNGKLREYNSQLYMENQDLKNKLIYRNNDIAKLTTQNESLKAEVERLLSDLNIKFSNKKPVKENLELHRKFDKLSKLQEECFLVTKQVQAFLSDFEDITENGMPYDYEALVDKLVTRIKPKLYRAYDLNVAENDLLEVDIDLGKIIDERRKPENHLFS